MSDLLEKLAWHEAFELIPYGVLLLAEDAALLYANTAALKTLGLSDKANRSFFDFLDNPESRANIERQLKALDSQESVELEIPLRARLAP